MHSLRWKRIFLASAGFCVAFLICAPHFVVPAAAKAPQAATSTKVPETQQQSHITAVSISGSEAAGTFGGVAYKRTWGTVSGIVAPRDVILGLDSLPHDADGNYVYQSEFEIVAPEKPGTNSVIVIEAENRGTPVFLNALHESAVSGPPSATTTGGDPGNGFLFAHATSYARVQWQTGIAASVPENAEGVGEVIIRDFGAVAGRAHASGRKTFRGVWKLLDADSGGREPQRIFHRHLFS